MTTSNNFNASVGFSQGASYVPQEYQVLYLELGGNLMTEVQSITVMRTDGGADVATLCRDYAGRVKGAAKADVTFKGVVPFNPTDVTGPAFANGGMTIGAGTAGSGGAAPAGTQLDAAMLTSINQYGNAPVKFTILVGNPEAQQLVFLGFIHELTVDSSVGKPTDFTCRASGQFTLFG